MRVGISLASALFLLVMPVMGHASSVTNISAMALSGEPDFFQSLDLARPDLAEVRAAVNTRDWPQAKVAWARHLADRTTPQWIWSRRDRPAIVRLYDENFGGLARYTNAADRVLARDFNLLGVRQQLAHKVQWLQGPVEWTHVLSRFGYWQDYGRAYWGTEKSIYARDFVDLLEDWIQSNPVPAQVSNERGEHGSVWRTLEAGIRGQSWFDAMEFFMDAPEFDPQAKYLMSKSLVEHARYLSAWDTRFRGGNWQVCEAAGLATVGIMLPEFKEAAGWRQRGLNLLVEHMQHDVEADGMHWELTPGYHTWVMNEFLHVSLLCQKNHLEIPGLMSRHEKMYEVLEKLARPDRTYPPVGDAGTGTASVAETMGVGALLYHRPDFRYLAADRCAEDWVWLFGPEVCQRYAALDSRVPDFTSVLLTNSQYTVMRTGWNPPDKYLLFDCAPWRGGHSHQDRLQVTVFAGRDLLVDAGMCSYDEPVSRELRVSAAHNVVMIDGQEQLQADPKLIAWHSDTAVDFAGGEVTAGGLTHRRSVLFVKPDYWVVLDNVEGQGSHEVKRLFHFPLGPAKVVGNAAQTDFPKGTNLRVQSVDGSQLEMQAGQIATSLATVEKAPVAVFTNTGKLPLTLCTLLLPFRDAKDLPIVNSLGTDDAGQKKFEICFPNGQHDEIVIAGATADLSVANQKVKARVLCVRRGPQANGLITIP